MAFVLKGPARFGFYLCTVLLALFSLSAFGHTIEGSDASFVEAIDGPAIFPFMYLGAKHMVTGYDHLLFLVGVIFFLYRPKHVVQYVTLFAIGHSITLLFGVLADLQVNAYIIDAIIGLSVVYKGFDNLGGFKRCFNWQPDARVAVFIFGLCHGFGLATKLQEFELSDNGLFASLVAFNLGVEVGQFSALAVILILITAWRKLPSFQRFATTTNTLLMSAGLMLMGYQLTGYFLS